VQELTELTHGEGDLIMQQALGVVPGIMACDGGVKVRLNGVGPEVEHPLHSISPSADHEVIDYKLDPSSEELLDCLTGGVPAGCSLVF
jgi:hypothetical protein